MTNQAVHAGLVGKIKILVLPTITDMAHGAGRPVGLDPDAEVVDDIAFTNAHQSLMPGNDDFFALPVPVRGLHDLGAGVWMAFQAGTGHGRTVRESRLEEGCMICVHRVLGKLVRGAGYFGWLCIA